MRNIFSFHIIFAFPAIILVFYIAWKEPRFVKRLGESSGWIENNILSTLLFSIPVFIACVFLLPVLQEVIAGYLSPLVKTYSDTSQGAISSKAVESTGLVVGVLISSTASAMLAAIEELLFRGMALQFLKDKTGKIVAVLSSAALFGAYHLAEPGFGTGMGIYASISALVFGTVYLKTGLAGAIIVHSGTNFVFGISLLL